MSEDLLVDLEEARGFLKIYWVFRWLVDVVILLWDTDDLFYPGLDISLVDFWVGSVVEKFMPKTDFIYSMAGRYYLSLEFSLLKTSKHLTSIFSTYFLFYILSYIYEYYPMQ